MAERRRRQDWARPPGPPPAPRMEHPGPEHDVPPYTSLQANLPEHRGAAQGGERLSAPRQPADPTPTAAQRIPTALALDSKFPIRAPAAKPWVTPARAQLSPPGATHPLPPDTARNFPNKATHC